MPPAETFDRAGNPSVSDLSPTSDPSRRSAYEGSCLASIRNDSLYPSSNGNRVFLSASDYPVQPHVIPTTLRDIRNTVSEASVRTNVDLESPHARIVPIEPLASNPSMWQLKQPLPRHVPSRRFGIPPPSIISLFSPAIGSDSTFSPWHLSIADPNIYGGLPFPRAGTPSPDSETPDIENAAFSRYPPEPKDLSSYGSYVPTSHVAPLQHATWVHRGHDTKDDHDADSAYANYTERPEDANAAYANASNTPPTKRDDADMEDWTTDGVRALQEDFAQGMKGQVAPKQEYTYWDRSS